MNRWILRTVKARLGKVREFNLTLLRFNILKGIIEADQTLTKMFEEATQIVEEKIDTKLAEAIARLELEDRGYSKHKIDLIINLYKA